MKCINLAWDKHENELRNFLRGQVREMALAEDLLQDVFVKALSDSSHFCQLENPRAWLYRVARNRVIDYRRTHKIHTEVDDGHPHQVNEISPVVNLSKCLPTALTKLSAEDKEIIEKCDLEGMNQAEFAKLKNITVPGAKSRIQRARKRLKVELHIACQIVLDDMGNVCCFDPNCK